MKIWIPTNPYWYVAVLVFFGPYVAEMLFGPAWVVKLLAVSVLLIGVPVVLLFYGLTSKMSSSIKEDAPLVKKYGKRPMVLVGRIVFITFGLLMSLLLPALGKDFVAIAEGNAPLTRSGVVQRVSGGAPPGAFISPDIVFGGEPGTPTSRFPAWYFPLRYFKIGSTYEVVYLPNTHYILEARLITEDL